MKSKDKPIVDNAIKNLHEKNLKSLAKYIWLSKKGKKRDIDILTREIERIHMEQNNEVKAKVISDIDLNDDEKKEITTKMSGITNKKISAEYIIDNSIIGGVKIIFEGEVIDYSLKGRVDALRDKIRG